MYSNALSGKGVREAHAAIANTGSAFACPIASTPGRFNRAFSHNCVKTTGEPTMHPPFLSPTMSTSLLLLTALPARTAPTTTATNTTPNPPPLLARTLCMDLACHGETRDQDAACMAIKLRSLPPVA
ncbi:hypothetical protein MMC21_006752 [Puttea exsequens]|nr:hypothetical protein [Puttea exsequens]